MAKYKAYPEYKDSGVEFLGLVPNEWSVKSLKNIVVIVNGSTPKSGVEEYWDGNINWITPTDLSQKSGVYLNDSQRKITNKGLDSCGTSLVPENTVILSTRAPIGSLAIAGTQSCTNQGCKSLVVRNKESSLFLYYYLSISTSSLNNLGRGSTFLELSTEDLASFKVPMPNVGIGTVVSFLDHETAKIDNLIEKQQQLIELLKEKRQAVISHAVTKGLNPDVPMKDSGIEWLGDVPAHWDICFLKFKCYTITDGAHISPDTNEGKHYFVSIKDIKKGIIDFNNSLLTSSASYKYLVETGCKPFSGDILFSKDGTIGQTAIVSDEVDFVVASSLIIIRPDNEKVLPSFMDLLLQSSLVKEQVESFVKGAALRRLSIQNLEKVFGVFPTMSEQQKISDYINAQLNRLDVLESKAIVQIQLLQERRTALISASVTGKIDVRDWVAPDMQDAEEPQETTA